MATLLITGASGFIGQHLMAYLRAGHDCVPYHRGQAVRVAQDAVIHLAGKAHDVRQVADPSDYLRSNVELTQRVFDAFLKSSASVFIFVSSVKAVADAVQEPLTEAHPADPQTPYGQSKRQAELHILSQVIPEGKRVYILRPCMVHGPGNKGNLNLLHAFVARGIPWPLGAFHNLRSYCAIDNFCFVIQHLLARSDIPSGIYHVADDAPVSTNQIVHLIAEASGRRARILSCDPALITAVARVGDALHLPITTERLHKLTETYVVSNAKLVSAIGTSLPVSSLAGMRVTLRAFAS